MDNNNTFYKGVPVATPTEVGHRSGYQRTSDRNFAATIKTLYPNIVIECEANPQVPNIFYYYIPDPDGVIKEKWNSYQTNELLISPRLLMISLNYIRDLRPSTPQNICRICHKATAFFTGEEMCELCDKKYYFDKFHQLIEKGKEGAI